MDFKETIQEFLAVHSKEDVGFIMEYIEPLKEFLGIDYSDLTMHEYSKVIKAFKRLGENDIAGMVLEIIGKDKITEAYLMKLESVKVLGFIRHLLNEIERISELEKTYINSDIDGKLLSAGIEKLDVFEEINVYASINPNPKEWESLSKLPYHLIFTYLWRENTVNKIQDNLHKKHNR